MYLDTDILAIGDNVDAVFQEYISPIRFAADHCRVKQFSPYAVNCDCLKTREEYRRRINVILAEADPLFNTTNTRLRQLRKQLETVFFQLKQNKIKAAFTALRYFSALKRFDLNPDFYFDKQKKIWFYKDGTAVIYHVSMRKAAKQAGLRYNAFKDQIEPPDGLSIWLDRCDHLTQYISQKFKVTVAEKDWQHWNGGVFLFDDDSYNFLETWHQYTLQIFQDPKWKTRDQGTLIATVWKFGLQNQPVLNPTWNCLADHFNQNLALSADKQMLTLDGENFFAPEFAHIYHHWGDTTWDIWNWAASKA